MGNWVRVHATIMDSMLLIGLLLVLWVAFKAEHDRKYIFDLAFRSLWFATAFSQMFK